MIIGAPFYHAISPTTQIHLSRILSFRMVPLECTLSKSSPVLCRLPPRYFRNPARASYWK
jgi:hypothetical protein